MCKFPLTLRSYSENHLKNRISSKSQGFVKKEWLFARSSNENLKKIIITRPNILLMSEGRSLCTKNVLKRYLTTALRNTAMMA